MVPHRFPIDGQGVAAVGRDALEQRGDGLRRLALKAQMREPSRNAFSLRLRDG